MFNLKAQMLLPFCQPWLLRDLPVVVLTGADVTVADELVVLLHQHVELMRQAVHLPLQVRNDLRHGFVVVFEMLRVHGPVGLVSADGVHREALIAVFVAEGVVEGVLAVFDDVVHQVADLMFESDEAGCHWLDASLDVFDVGSVLEGDSAGAAFTLALVDLMMDIRIWERMVSYAVMKNGIGVR